jgi:hypothetical protein
LERRKAAGPHNASIELTPPAGGTHSLPHLALPVYAILNGPREVLTESEGFEEKITLKALTYFPYKSRV